MLRLLAACLLTLATIQSLPAEDGLVAHWPLAREGMDVSGNGLHAKVHGVEFAAGERLRSATFDGRQSWLQAPVDDRLKFGTGDFSISLWVHTEKNLDDVPGDLFS